MNKSLNDLKELKSLGGILQPVNKCRFAFFPVHPLIGAMNGQEFGSCVVDVKLDMKNKRVVVHTRVPCSDGLYQTIHRMVELDVMTLRLKHFRGFSENHFTLCLTNAKVERHEVVMTYEVDDATDLMVHEFEFSYKGVIIEEGKAKSVADPMPVKADNEVLTPAEAMERLRKIQEDERKAADKTVDTSKE